MMNANTKILVSGASGMIGAALCRRLNNRDILAPSHAELELRDQKAVFRYFETHRPDFVYHLAARVGGIHANSHFPGQFLYDNTQMQLNVLEAARHVGVKKLLFPGSACTYPKMETPIAESEFLKGVIEPTNLAYAAAKINGIVMAQSYAKEYGIKMIVPMPTNAYGIGDNFDPNASHVIPALMKRFYDAKQNNVPEVVLWGSGAPLREFIYADDVADAFVFLMEHCDLPEIINVGTNQEISIKNLAQEIAGIVGYEGAITQDTTKPDGAIRKVLDSSKLFALGWQPKTPLREGLSRMFQHHFHKQAA
jgi:GDP-L-fucose synthase